MNKDTIASIITSAKRSHKTWLENARTLVEGMPLDKEQVPVNSTDCQFGKWYYGEGQALKAMINFKEIEGHHDALHQTYREIFVLLFVEGDKKASLFSRFFGKAQKSSKENEKLARDKLQVLEQQSKTIMKKLDELERMVVGMSEEQINSYINKRS